MQDEEGKTQIQATPAAATPQTPVPAAAVVQRPLPEHINRPISAEGNTYLHELCRQKADLSLIVEAVEVFGAIVDMPNQAGLPPLAYAISEGDVETVDCLHRLGASVVTGNFNAVLYAVDANKPEALIHLLHMGRGAGVNLGGICVNKETSKDTPLLMALSLPRGEMIAPLLAAGALTCRRRVKDNATAVHLAADLNSAETLQLLLQAGADATLQDAKGQTPLHIAVASGRVVVLQALVDRSINIDVAMNDGLSPLHLSVIKKQMECMQILLAAGAKFDTPVAQMDDETPLMSAARHGHDEIAAELVAAGADPLAQNKQRKTAADMVNQENRRELYTFLKAEEDYRLCDQFEKAHRRLIEEQGFAKPKAPPRFGG